MRRRIVNDLSEGYAACLGNSDTLSIFETAKDLSEITLKAHATKQWVVGSNRRRRPRRNALSTFGHQWNIVETSQEHCPNKISKYHTYLSAQSGHLTESMTSYLEK